MLAIPTHFTRTAMPAWHWLESTELEALADYVRHRTGIMRSIRLSQAAAKGKKASKRSERQRTLLEKGALAWVEDMLERKKPYDSGIAWDDLGIDFLVFDELGLYRNTFKPTEREFGVPMYMGSLGKPAKRAWQADFRAAVVRRNTGGRGFLSFCGRSRSARRSVKSCRSAGVLR